MSDRGCHSPGDGEDRTGEPAGPPDETVVSDGGVRTDEVTVPGRPSGTTPVEDDAETAATTVLHVDDDPEVGFLVREFVERTDHEVDMVTKTDAAAALERVETGDVDCVVTDVEMPGMDGRELVRAIGARHPELPVVLFTSCTWREVGDETLATSVDDYVQKFGGHGQFEAVAEAVFATLD